jgi:aspartate/tyrosine/aromatic aminotransferase
MALTFRPEKRVLGVEELGWPAYLAIARIARLGHETFGKDEPIQGSGVQPLYQAGPLNTTGRVAEEAAVRARADAAAEAGDMVVLDRAYSGFEFAHRLGTDSYEQIMRRSYDLQIAPFVEAQVPCLIAVSPTKAFVTFSLRPAGLLLAYTPDPSHDGAVENALNTAIRARGASFEHPVTRAFAHALVTDLERLEREHEDALRRTAEAANRWRQLSEGTAIEYLFTEQYAGLFRNPPARDDAAENIYGEHLYPVFSGGRCRLNVTGIPDDPKLASSHVQVFGTYCYEE